MSVSNSAPNGKLFMNIVTGSLFNEETMRKSADTNDGQALVIENKGRSQNKSQSRGRNKSRGKSKSKGRACFHCGKECYMKRNGMIWLREQKEGKKKIEDNKNTIAIVLDDEVATLTSREEQCLHVRDHQGIESIVDSRAMHDTTLNKDVFTSYRT